MNYMLQKDKMCWICNKCKKNNRYRHSMKNRKIAMIQIKIDEYQRTKTIGNTQCGQQNKENEIVKYNPNKPEIHKKKKRKINSHFTKTIILRILFNQKINKNNNKKKRKKK